MHDYDNNMKLDGLEILMAVSDFHHDGTANASPPLNDQQLMNLIDPILEEDDKNQDGYVDYPEFAATQIE
ncbi:Multiple coagulation factor deficiency protein 2-like [Holothuria leucospilota]|uniref:Multiple coagulation factor deficiency protein 2-like n=1 Tax=Holothuria leucospilota TaxID=206669 RepID=A0A9Q1CFW3_HOLLE|nr:Multiple coagulation factor deficiency protein 2-like [Holothuria leucospilota]